MMTIIKGFCSDTNEVQRIPLDDERVAFRMLEALDFKVYVKVGPLDGFGAAHLNVEHAANRSVRNDRYLTLVTFYTATPVRITSW